MTSALDRPSKAFGQGPRSFGLYEALARNAEPQPVPATEPRIATETVTLSKIGDFLEVDFRRLFTWLRAGLWLALVLAVAGAAGGYAYGLFTAPKYTVDTEILIDPTNLQVISNDIYQAPGQVDGQLADAASKLRILTSGNVLARVVDDLNLISDPEFYDPTPAGFSLGALLGGSSSADKANPKLAALQALERRVTTKADEKSYVATLMVSSESADKSIRISDAIVKEFQAELAKAESDGAARTAKALGDRLDALKTDVNVSEEKVETYRRDHNLSATSDGSLISSQTMSQVNTQVLDAQQKVIAAQSAYDGLVAAGRNATTSDLQESQALTTLRAKAGDLQQQYDSAAVTYGTRHPVIVKLKSEIDAVNGQLDVEVGRIVSAAKSNLDDANAQLTALTARSSALTSNVFTDNEAMVTLRELQRDADSKAQIYQAFLSRAREVTQREQIDTSNVRVISTAVPPEARSWPPRNVVLLMGGAFGGAFLGLLLAIGLGIARDMRGDRRRNIGTVATA